MLPPASLVIPSLNRPRLLVETVESVLAGDTLPAEIVVVDQSADPNEDLLALSSSGRLRYFNVAPEGVSAARNAGVAAAELEVVAFLDDDVFVEPDWFQLLLEALQAAGPRTAVTGRVLPGVPEVLGGVATTSRMSELPAVFEGRVDESPLYFLNAAVPRAAFQEVGGFDPRLGPGTPFPSGEDTDVGFRLLEAGYRVVYVPEAVVHHRAWRSGDAVKHIRFSYGLGHGAFYAKHMSLRDRYMLKRLGLELARQVRLIGSRLRSDRGRAQRDAAYLAGIFCGLGRWWAMAARRRGARLRG